MLVEDLAPARAVDEVKRGFLLLKKAFWRRADWWNARVAMEEVVEVFANCGARRAGPWRSVIVKDIGVMCLDAFYQSLNKGNDGFEGDEGC